MGNQGDEAKQDGYIEIFREANAYRVRYRHHTGYLYMRMVNSEDELRELLERLANGENLFLSAALEKVQKTGSATIDHVMLSVGEAMRYFPGGR